MRTQNILKQSRNKINSKHHRAESSYAPYFKRHKKYVRPVKIGGKKLL